MLDTTSEIPQGSTHGFFSCPDHWNDLTALQHLSERQILRDPGSASPSQSSSMAQSDDQTKPDPYQYVAEWERNLEEIFVEAMKLRAQTEVREGEYLFDFPRPGTEIHESDSTGRPKLEQRSKEVMIGKLPSVSVLKQRDELEQCCPFEAFSYPY